MIECLLVEATGQLGVVPVVGLEPTRPSKGPQDFKSCASAISPHRRTSRKPNPGESSTVRRTPPSPLRYTYTTFALTASTSHRAPVMRDGFFSYHAKRQYDMPVIWAEFLGGIRSGAISVGQR